MSSSLLQRCQACGQQLTNHSLCGNQCGLSLPEGNLRMQEDLVALFSKQMNMGDSASSGALPPVPTPITYSITQHYHHSAHVTRNTIAAGLPEQESFSGPPSASTSIEEVLVHHNVDPSSLSPRQLQLFEYAMPEQRSRLIQMWQICSDPGSSVGMKGSDLTSPEMQPSTPNIIETPGLPSQIQQGGNDDDMDMCDSVRERETGDDSQQYAEPYMISGYDLVAQKHNELAANRVSPLVDEPTTGSPYKIANDPVYGNQRWWERTQSGSFEDRYALFEEPNRYPGCGLVGPHWLR